MSATLARAIGNAAPGTDPRTTLPLTTTADVEAGETVVLGVKWYVAGSIASVTDDSGSPLAYSVAAARESVTRDDEHMAFVIAHAPDGLESGSVITVTFSGDAYNCNVIGAAFSGVASTSPVDVTATGVDGSDNPWTTGAATNTQADAIYIAFASIVFRDTTSSPLGGFTEAIDYHAAADNASLTMVYLGVSSTGARTGQGNWAADGQPWMGIMVVLKAGGVAPANETPAVVAGTAQVTQTLTYTPGEWAGSPTPDITGQWQRSDDGSTGWADIDGETGSTYAAAPEDQDKYLSVLETAENTEGDDTERSNVVGPVAAAPPLAFSIRLSGGASNTSPAASIGGAESSHNASSNLLDIITGVQARDGHTDYRVIYVHNDDETDATVNAWINDDEPYPGSEHLAIAVALEDAGVPALANETSAPEDVSFSSPHGAESGLTFSVPAGSGQGIYIERTYAAETIESASNPARIVFTVTPA